ncbi:MAG: diguanylate cyclase [Gammaproteobacteria bacterium]|nr:diguanylate cyclase [Gammaproteobacteria bacterium]
MTIFQRMLIPPLLGLALYTGLIFYGANQYKQGNSEIKSISEDYLSLLELSGENSHLFSALVTQFKDAVLSGEYDWVSSTNTHKEKINHNFSSMSQHPELIDKTALQKLRSDFNRYYSNALTLSFALLKTSKDFSVHEPLIQDVEHYANHTHTGLTALKQGINSRFNYALEQSNATLNNLLFWGGGSAVLLILLMFSTTVLVSFSTRKSFQAIIDKTQGLAEGRTDFSQRLTYNKHDELGYLVYWFNKLSDALEQDYTRIEQLSITDPLTQLSNRSHTDEYLKKHLSHGLPARHALIVIIADIDHFKAVNDNYGHLAGDHVLREFSQLLKEHTRTQDFVGRWGGEEFIIAMPDITPGQAVKNAERLRSAIEDYDFGSSGPVTASFGVALSTEHDTRESLIGRADECLYKAKSQGRNRIITDKVFAQSGHGTQVSCNQA